MTHPLTPREKVAEQTVGPVNYDRLRSAIHSATHAALPFAEAPMTIPFSTQERAALQAEIADLIISNLDKATAPLAALASSGDHAELAREVERTSFWREARDSRDFVIDEPCDADDYGAEERPVYAEWVRKSVLALLAENSALRDREKAALKECSEWARKAGEAIGKLETSEAAGIVEGWKERATEAERKLAEAVGLLRDVVSPGWTRDAWSKARSFLSKEAERG